MQQESKNESYRKKKCTASLYFDDSVMEEQKYAEESFMKLNFADRSDFDTLAEIVKELLGNPRMRLFNPPFYCDYGKNIEVGKNFFANYNCTNH